MTIQNRCRLFALLAVAITPLACMPPANNGDPQPTAFEVTFRGLSYAVGSMDCQLLPLVDARYQIRAVGDINGVEVFNETSGRVTINSGDVLNLSSFVETFTAQQDQEVDIELTVEFVNSLGEITRTRTIGDAFIVGQDNEGQRTLSLIDDTCLEDDLFVYEMLVQ